MVYITGDCHGEYQKFSVDFFPAQREMTRDDFVIVCGDFGLWDNDDRERWWLNWLNEKNFTLLFVDGNHENFDRLYSEEFEVVNFHGGKAHKIRDNIYHLMRGHVFEFCGKKFFAFGGASSHDIDDGILDPDDFVDEEDFRDELRKWRNEDKMFRVNHKSWWKEELPSDEEMKFGLTTLEENNNKVDYIISHCAPQEIVSVFSYGFYPDSDKLTKYFNEILNKVSFDQWFCGHYHEDTTILSKHHILYRRIIRVV